MYIEAHSARNYRKPRSQTDTISFSWASRK